MSGECPAGVCLREVPCGGGDGDACVVNAAVVAIGRSGLTVDEVGRLGCCDVHHGSEERLGIGVEKEDGRCRSGSGGGWSWWGLCQSERCA